MKRINISILVMGMLVFASCGNDDNVEEDANCQTAVCFYEEPTQGETVTTLCDNGDGTVTVKLFGTEYIDELGDATFDEFVAAFFGSEAFTCNRSEVL